MEGFKLYLENLSFKTTIESLNTFFSKFGEIKSRRIDTNRDSLSKGKGFIEFNNEKSLLAAFEALKDQELDNRKVNSYYDPSILNKTKDISPKIEVKIQSPKKNNYESDQNKKNIPHSYSKDSVSHKYNNSSNYDKYRDDKYDNRSRFDENRSHRDDYLDYRHRTHYDDRKRYEESKSKNDSKRSYR